MEISWDPRAYENDVFWIIQFDFPLLPLSIWFLIPRQ